MKRLSPGRGHLYGPCWTWNGTGDRVHGHDARKGLLLRSEGGSRGPEGHLKSARERQAGFKPKVGSSWCILVWLLCRFFTFIIHISNQLFRVSRGVQQPTPWTVYCRGSQMFPVLSSQLP